MKTKSPENFLKPRLTQLTESQKLRPFRHLWIVSMVLVVLGILVSARFERRSIAESSPALQPALGTTTTIVNYNFNAGTSYAALTPTLASGISCTASSTQPFQNLPGVP